MLISRQSILILFPLILVIITMTVNSSAEDNLDGTGNNNRSFTNFLGSWSKQDYLTGNWGGYREKLKDKGIDIFGFYYATVLGNPIGGRSKGVSYAGLLDLFINLDLEKLIGVKGSSFRISGYWSSGRSLTEDFIGNFFNVSSAFNGDSVGLYQLYFEQSLFDDILNIALGRMATGDDFMTSPIFYNFVSLAFDQNPVSIFFNIPSFTADPTSTWGVRAKVAPVKEFYAMFGLYDSNPATGRISSRNFEPSFNGEGLIIGEVGFSVNNDRDLKGLPGNYKVGGYYDTSNFALLSAPEAKRSGNYGFYLLMDQMIYREGAPGSDQGLTPFATFTLAPSNDINTFPFFFSTGMVYEGLFPSRDTDTTSFGFSYGNVSKDLIGQDFEILMELSHIFNITPWLSVQPDIQYVIHPGGSSQIPNAFVIGFALDVNL
jgi:porin